MIEGDRFSMKMDDAMGDALATEIDRVLDAADPSQNLTPDEIARWLPADANVDPLIASLSNWKGSSPPLTIAMMIEAHAKLRAASFPREYQRRVGSSDDPPAKPPTTTITIAGNASDDDSPRYRAARVQGYQCPTCERGVTTRNGHACRACSSRFVVMRGAEAVGRVGIEARNTDAACAEVRAHAICKLLACYTNGVQPPGVILVPIRAASDDQWFVVDTEAPTIAPSNPTTHRIDPDGTHVYRNSPVFKSTDGEVSTVRETIAPTPPTDAEIVALDDWRIRGDASHNAWSGVTLRSAIAWRGRPITDDEVYAARDRIAKATPPTDEWLARFLETEIQAMSDEPDRPLLFGGPGAGDFDVNGHRFTIADMRAAWSRVLAARCAASDEKRRLDAMVYGPIDDAEEV